MPQHNDLSRSLVALEPDSTVIAVIEMSQSSWLVAGIVSGIDRHPLKKLEPDKEGVLRLLRRWQEEVTRAGRIITRVAVAFEAGRDGFWLARWLRARGIEAHVPEGVSFATKPHIAAGMVERARQTGVPFMWVAADLHAALRHVPPGDRCAMVYGTGEVEMTLRQAGKGYVLGVPSNEQVWSWGKLPAVSGTAEEVAAALPASA